ncbi:MAG: endonuclease/exonuclease/phosphatase family protein [Chloroflexota bacterium]
MLTVLSLNINQYVDRHGAWEQRSRAIVDVLRQARPDIVALQAVQKDAGRDGGVDQAMQLARLSGEYPHVVFQPAETRPAALETGVALLSRLPIERVEPLKLSLRPGLEDTQPRVALLARFARPGGVLNLINIHFSWVEAQLQDNLAEALPFVRQIEGPGLLIGDFNAPAGQGRLYLLEEAGWVDAWTRLCGAQDGFTYPSSSPNLRIDYAWANPQLALALRRIQVVGDGPPELSDHLGLLLSLDI